MKHLLCSRTMIVWLKSSRKSQKTILFLMNLLTASNSPAWLTMQLSAMRNWDNSKRLLIAVSFLIIGTLPPNSHRSTDMHKSKAYFKTMQMSCWTKTKDLKQHNSIAKPTEILNLLRFFLRLETNWSRKKESLFTLKNYMCLLLWKWISTKKDWLTHRWQGRPATPQEYYLFYA